MAKKYAGNWSIKTVSLFIAYVFYPVCNLSHTSNYTIIIEEIC